MKRLSIRKQLLTLFVPVLFSLWIITTVLSLWLVSRFSADLFDRDLINSADSVVGRLRVKQEKVVVDLPPAAQAILKHDESDRLYYRVIGVDGKRISGDGDLPDPSPNLIVGEPKIVTGVILGRNVRLAEIKATVDDEDGQTVIVQFAETTNVRRLFEEKMLLSIALPQILVLALGAFAIWYGISRILTPLGLLQKQVANRSQVDLSPLSDDETPEEVYPLVKALNLLFKRLTDEIQAHQRFIANAAHQLRTPLAGLKTYSSIGKEMSDPKELQHIVHELDHGIDRASRMVAQLLALARADGGDPDIAKAKGQIDLNFLVSDAVAELVNQAVPKDIDLTYEWSDKPAIILGDQTGLKHLLANLIDNALSYCAPGDKVLVSVRQDTHVTLAVIDTGPGIPVEERNKVFERFYRINGNITSGSGLGLSIVKEVAAAHNATVSIELGPGGRGTSVLVEFPRAGS
jgi:two-component system, OmpR family, sensor histidine kinase TctE